LQIPFALHHRIPKVRRVLELLASTTAERDALRDKCRELQEKCTALSGDIENANTTTQALRNAVQSEVAEDRPLLYGSRNHEMGRGALRILSLLRPMDVVGGRLVRKGRPFDGGYAMVDRGLEKVVAYSLGVNDDVSWDLDMAQLGCQVYQYDHTIEALPVKHPSFHWSKIGIDATPSADGTLRPLADLIRENGHAKRRDLILKMDIEGFEWQVFAAMSGETIDQFSQIVIELHMLALCADELQRRIIGVLEKLYRSHQPVHVHANNHGYFGFIGGVPIPDAVEVTYVRRVDHHFAPCMRTFPDRIDMPCRRDIPDFFLGALGALPPLDIKTD
jgi:hypothetical protein